MKVKKGRTAKVQETKRERIKEFAIKHYMKIVAGHCIFACTVIAVCLALYLQGIITSDLQYLISAIPVVTQILLKYFLNRQFYR